MLFDLDDLPSRLRLFSHNRFNLISFHDRDHLDGSGGLRGQVEAAMAAAGLQPDGGAIRLLCMPRVLGHAFNPITRVLLLPPRRRPDRHAVRGAQHLRRSAQLPDPGRGPAAKTIRQALRQGVLRLAVHAHGDDLRVPGVPPGETTAVVVHGDDAEGRVITASFAGRRKAVGRRAGRHRAAARDAEPEGAGAIHWEAAKLWLKGLRVQPRPAPPDNPVTVVSILQG